MTVFVYVNTSKQDGDPEHVKVFATTVLFVIFILGIGTAALLAGRQVRRRRSLS
ncbi:hypothetical protein KIP88_45790 [Bradyrhizobium sp. SRL28]|uniref:hypothetical protein n=1 Tax=Bradyrhizobium sp. SRL28 TaxID=2836178 RepID=UPI001BDE2AFC|nr:hypothetical protein [Bradyrhizobium sp. SRL28]MBT1517583.1 hypothetical protein [Bradyrhizobium sp. SRL28]